MALNQLFQKSLLSTVTRSLGIRAHHVAVQKPAPDFKGTAVINQNFQEIQLKDFSGRYLYLFFYPLDFTFVCPTEIIAFSDRVDEFKQELNTDVVACSVDSHFSHLAWVNTPRKQGGLGEMKIPILSDLTKKISSDYNVLTDGGISLRGSFLIDPKGIVRHLLINDLPVGRSVDEALRVIKAFQFFEKNGEVCPANWQPNKPTINTAKPSEYFSKVN